MQQTQAVMEVRGLTKRFAVGGGGLLRRGERRYVHAVDDVSFTLEKGRILALVGESGSGKSTIARMLARLYPPTAGQVRLKGRDALSHQNRRAVLRYRNDVQMIFQDPFGSLNPVKTVGHHLARPLAIHKGLKGRAGDEVAQLYYRDVAASVARPDRMLIGFARLFLAPGEAKQITFTVHPSRLAFYDPRMRFVTEPGEFVFSVGASSADIRCEQAVVLTGAVAPYRQRDIIATRTVIA